VFNPVPFRHISRVRFSDPIVGATDGSPSLRIINPLLALSNRESLGPVFAVVSKQISAEIRDMNLECISPSIMADMYSIIDRTITDSHVLQILFPFCDEIKEMHANAN